MTVQSLAEPMRSGFGGRRGLVLVVAVAVVLAGSAVVTGAFSADQPSGEEVLERTGDRYESAETLSSTAVVTVENDTDSVSVTVEMAVAPGNKSRLVVTRDGTTYRAGTNGSVAWVAGPDRAAAWPVDAIRDGTALPDEAAMGDADGPRSAVTGDDARLSPQGRPTMNGSNVSATLVGTPTVDGTSTYEVELTHTEANGTATLWVAQDDYRVVRAVATDGTNRTVVDVQSTSFDVSIHESTFDPPADRVSLAGADSYEDFGAAQSNTDITLPSLDATFEGATVTVRGGETVVGQRYVDDGQNVTVVSTTASERFDGMLENATETEVDGRTVSVTSAEDRAVAVWTDDGLTTAVVVEGSTDRAVEIAGEL